MRRHYHPPSVVSGAADICGDMSRQAGRKLVASVLAGVAWGVRRSAPDETAGPAGEARPTARELFSDRSAGPGGHYSVPSYNGGGRPVQLPVHQPAPAAFELDDDLREYPDMEEILHSPEMRRYFGLRDRFHRLHPKGKRLPDFARLRSDQPDLPKLLELIPDFYSQLQKLSELEWEVLESQVGKAGKPALPNDWYEAKRHIASFMNDPDRIQAVREAAARDAAIKAVHARVDPAQEAKAIKRLAGLEDLYEAIKHFERAGSGSGQHTAEFGMIKQQRRSEMDRLLGAAGFADVGEFDAAVRVLRGAVRERAVFIALATMKESERVLQAEYQRYREPGVLAKLAGDIKKLPPLIAMSQAALLKLLDDYPLLNDPVARRGAWQVGVPDLLGDHLRQNATAQLYNIARTRAKLDKNPEAIFSLDLVIDAVLDQANLPPKTVQALLIREGRAASKSLLDRLWGAAELVLIVLSFAAGPVGVVAAVGMAARAALLASQIGRSVQRSNAEEVVRAAAHMWKPLANEPVPSAQIWELFGLFLAMAGTVLPAPPRSLLLPNRAQLAGQAGQLLAAGAAKRAIPLQFRHGTVFSEVSPGQVVAWHPLFPDDLMLINADGVRAFSKAGGVARQTGHWPWSAFDSAGAPTTTPISSSALVRSSAPAASPKPAPPKPAPPKPAPPKPAPPKGTAPPASRLLGAAPGLSPATELAQAKLRTRIMSLIKRTEDAVPGFGRFADEVQMQLLTEAKGIVDLLRSYEHVLTVGREGARLGRTHPAAEIEARAAIRWLKPKVTYVESRVLRLERRPSQLPLPTAVEQGVIRDYLERLTRLRDLHRRVEAGDGTALAARDQVRRELIRIEERAARYKSGEENLLFHLEPLTRSRKELIKRGTQAVLTGERPINVLAATIARGLLSGRSFAEINAAITAEAIALKIKPLPEPQFSLPESARESGPPSQSYTGAASVTWSLGGQNVIRIDRPAIPASAFEIATKAHLARIGPGNVHYSDDGIAVPLDSTPAHIPVREDGGPGSLAEAIDDARRELWERRKLQDERKRGK